MLKCPLCAYIIPEPYATVCGHCGATKQAFAVEPQPLSILEKLWHAGCYCLLLWIAGYIVGWIFTIDSAPAWLYLVPAWFGFTAKSSSVEHRWVR